MDKKTHYFFNHYFWPCFTLLKYILGVSRPKYFFNYDYERYNFFNIEHIQTYYGIQYIVLCIITQI